MENDRFEDVLMYAKQMEAEAAEMLNQNRYGDNSQYYFGVWVGCNRITKLIERQRMKMIDVKSSNIKKVGYDKKSSTLRVMFHSEQVYDYSPISHETFELLVSAESVGKFFNSHIKTDSNLTVKKTLI